MCLRYYQYEQLNDARRKFDENYEQQEQLRQLYEPSLLIDTLAIAEDLRLGACGGCFWR